MFKNLITYQDRHLYDQAACTSFRKKLNAGEDVWYEFLPLGDNSLENSITLKIAVGENRLESIKIPNLSMYMLKNEINNGALYGFYRTDLFNTLVCYLNNRETDGVISKGYVVPDESQKSGIRVIEINFKDKAELDVNLAILKSIARNFMRVNILFQTLADFANQNKAHKAVIEKMNIYTNSVLSTFGHKFSQNNSNEMLVKTRLHWFNKIEKAKTMNELDDIVSNHYVDFELFINNFMEFLYATTPNVFKDGKHTNPIKKVDLAF